MRQELTAGRFTPVQMSHHTTSSPDADTLSVRNGLVLFDGVAMETIAVPLWTGVGKRDNLYLSAMRAKTLLTLSRGRSSN